MIRMKEYAPEDMGRYCRRIIEHLEITSGWRNLQFKAEAGSTRSEKGYQMLAASMAERVAKALGICPHEAKVISMCVGISFPRGGQEGRALIADYVAERKIEIDMESLYALAIEDYISNRLFVATALDQALRAYYSAVPTEQLGMCAAAVVRVCQDAIRKIKQIELFTAADGGALLLETCETLPAACLAAGRPIESPELTARTAALPDYHQNRLTEEEKAAMVASLDGYVKAFGAEGILHYITTE